MYFIAIMYFIIIVYLFVLCCISIIHYNKCISYICVIQVPFTTQPAVASHIPKSRPFSGSQAAIAKKGRHGDRSHETNSIPYKQQQPVDLCVVSGRIVSSLAIIRSSSSPTMSSCYNVVTLLSMSFIFYQYCTHSFLLHYNVLFIC